MMFGLLLLFAHLTMIPQSEHVHIVRRASKAEPVYLTQDERRITLQSREARVSLDMPGGRGALIDLLMLYEPRSKLFWWTHQFGSAEHSGGLRTSFFPDAVIFQTKTKLVSFSGGIFLEVRESSEHYSSFQEGFAHVMAALEAERAKIEGGNPEGFILVNLGRSLPPSFVHLQGNAAPLPLPKLREVSLKGGEWQLVLDGPNGDSAIVLLDDKYEVIRANVIPPVKSQ